MEPAPHREESMPSAAPEITSTTPYQFEEDGEDFVLRIPKTGVTREAVQRFLDFLEFEHLRSKSQLTPEDAAELAREVEHAVWQANRHRFDAPASAKEKALDVLQRLPADASVEDMMEKLHFISEVERGLQQIAAGQVVSHEEAKRRFGR